MKIKTKITLGFGLLTVLFLVNSLIGLYGTQTLKDSLIYVTGTAWDTADGAMEGSIGIEAEIIGIARTLQRQHAEEPVSQLVSEGQETANEALGRMEGAGLIDQTTVSVIRNLRREFAEKRETLLSSHSSFLKSLNQLEQHFYEFQLLMESAEEVGDSQVEELEGNPEMAISWNGGLREKWSAADGGMEASIGLLKRIYYFQRLVSGKDFDQSIQGLKDARTFLQESMDELIEHPVFIAAKHRMGSRELSFSEWFKQSLNHHDQDFENTVTAYVAYNTALKAYEAASDRLLSKIEEVEELGDSTIEGEVGNITEQSDRVTYLMVSALVIGVLIAVIAASVIVISVSRPITAAVHIAEEIADEHLDVAIDTRSEDEVGALLRSMDRMRDNLRTSIERDRKLAADASRIKEALNVASANVMVADDNNDIIYMNDAAVMMFNNVESDIQRDITDFNANDLIGSNIDKFHKNPAHQHQLIKNLNGTLNSGFEVGGRNMKFVANPVQSKDGKRLGTVVEWSDQTAHVAIQQEIEGLITAARNGDLSSSISLDGKEGFFLGLSEGVNELVSTVAQVFDDIANVMSAMAQGGLQHKMTGKYAGTFREVQKNVNTTIESLNEIVSNIRGSTEMITSGADEISKGNNSLSDRTSQQAASLEQTVSAMEELTSTVRQNADNAQHATQLSDSARAKASESTDIVNDAVTAMEEINVSSNKISEIVGVIDGISFQTNLLALNAAVEAARAGEQGRGFAVVAGEVRNLAQRSATSAKEIKELILDSVNKVEAGSKLVNQSGDALKEIMDSVDKVGEIVAEISTASNEQAQGIDQINNTMTNLDSLTQQNAALAEEASAASVSMNDHAVKMSRQVEFFQSGAHVESAVVVK